MTGDDRVIWTAGDVVCLMISCCAGAELQLRRHGEIVLRELYPLKSDVYERAEMLKADYSDNRSDARHP